MLVWVTGSKLPDPREPGAVAVAGADGVPAAVTVANLVVVGGVRKTLQLCCTCARKQDVGESTQDLAERVGQPYPPGRPEPLRRPRNG
jgi:hypothetical protein